jgi:flagellar motor switch protein FliG
MPEASAPTPPASNATGGPGSGASHAAALLLALGADAAAHVLKALPDDKVASIARAARELRSADEGVVDVAVERFVRAMEGFHRERSLRPRAFEHLLVAAIGKDAAGRALEETHSIEEVAVRPIAEADAADVALLLESEGPEVIALVLSVLSPDKAKSILIELPAALQAPTLQRLAAFEAVEPGYVQEVISGLAQQVRELVAGPKRRPLSGERTAIDILRRFKAGERAGLIEELTLQDAELTGRIKSKLFAFDDIARLPRKAIQRVLQAADARSLAMALKGAAPSVAEVIMSNMSQRAAAALREEIDMLGRVKVAQVEGAQGEVVAIIMSLAEEGLIDIDLDDDLM